MDVKVFYLCLHFDVIDTIVQCLEDRFNQPGLKIIRNVKMLLFHADNGEEYDDELSNVCLVYRKEVNQLRLSAQLDLFENTFNDINFIDRFYINSRLKNLLKQEKLFFFKSDHFYKVICCFTSRQYCNPAFCVNVVLGKNELLHKHF